MPTTAAQLGSLRRPWNVALDVVSTVTSLGTDGFEATASTFVLRECLPHLPTKAFSARLLSSNREVALRLLRPRTSMEERQQEAMCNYHVHSLTRGLDELHDRGRASWAERRLLAALRERFIATPKDLNELRNRLAVALHTARDLRANLRASAEPALCNKQYFIFCLVDLLEHLDTLARHPALGMALLARPHVVEWTSASPGSPVVRGARGRARSSSPLPDSASTVRCFAVDTPAPINPPQRRLRIMPAEALSTVEGRASVSASPTPTVVPERPFSARAAATANPCFRGDFLPAWWRASDFVLVAAALGTVAAAWAAAAVGFVLLPPSAAAFVAAASPFLAAYVAVRLGRAAWRRTPSRSELLAAAAVEARRAEGCTGAVADRASTEATYLEGLAEEVPDAVHIRERWGRRLFGAGTDTTGPGQTA